jgi:hypothetical protein
MLKLKQAESVENLFCEALNLMQEKGDISKMLGVLSTEVPLLAIDNFNYIQLYFERLLP